MDLYKKSTAPLVDRISDLLDRMSAEECLQQLGGWIVPYGMVPGTIHDGKIKLSRSALKGI